MIVNKTQKSNQQQTILDRGTEDGSFQLPMHGGAEGQRRTDPLC